MSPFQLSSTVAISELGQLKVDTSPGGYPTLSTIEAQRGGGVEFAYSTKFYFMW